MNGGRGRETVQKLWSASRSLQGGGVSYYEYLTELTYLLLLKMLEEVKRQGKPLEERLPAKYRWRELKRLEGEKRLKHYRQVLQDLGDKKKVDFDLVNQIYAGAKTSLTKAMALDTLVIVIDEVDWYAAEEDGLGDLYEGLLEKTTSERKSKAGQYFTPRPLIDAIIDLVKPEVGKTIQDPAAGTGGFIIVAHRVILTATNDLTSLTPSESFFQRNRAYQGAELITDTQRLNTMNLLLHGIEMPLKCIDILSSDGENFEPADLILTNPPFNKFPERVTRGDFVFTAGGAKGPLSFVEHVVRGLKVGGRAAIVVPDNVLFEDNVGRQLRAWLMGQCDLHTILRLPTGIFYAQGVKTKVLFFTRRADKDVSATKTVWVYDMRAHMPSFGKTRPLTHEALHRSSPLSELIPMARRRGKMRESLVGFGRSRASKLQSAAAISICRGCAMKRIRRKRPLQIRRTSLLPYSAICAPQSVRSKQWLMSSLNPQRRNDYESRDPSAVPSSYYRSTAWLLVNESPRAASQPTT
jgi:type I restriction enzyme M protein